MKKLLFTILITVTSSVNSATPLPKQIGSIIRSINMYLDRTEQELNSDHKTKIALAKRQLENAQETIDELYKERYRNKFNHKHPKILKYQKRIKKLESRLNVIQRQ
jgi:hypothetical protein